MPRTHKPRLFVNFAGRRLEPRFIVDYFIGPELVEIGYKVYGGERQVFQVGPGAADVLIATFETEDQEPVDVRPPPPVRRPRGRPPKIKLIPKV